MAKPKKLRIIKPDGLIFNDPEKSELYTIPKGTVIKPIWNARMIKQYCTDDEYRRLRRVVEKMSEAKERPVLFRNGDGYSVVPMECFEPVEEEE